MLLRFGADATARDNQVCCFGGETGQQISFAKTGMAIHPLLAML